MQPARDSTDDAEHDPGRDADPDPGHGTEHDAGRDIASPPAPQARSRRWRAMLLAVACAALAAMPASAADAPDILVIFADDLGWKDVGFNRGELATPNLDRLAAGGAVLTAFYAQPYSTQTRAALLTGRYPMRYGLQTGSIRPDSRYGLPVEERTLAQGLKDRGYRTAFLGRWQLGHAKPDYWPTRRGFDYFYGTLSGRVDAQLRKGAKADWRRNEQASKEEGELTALLAKDAVALIERQDRSVPLFMMIAFTTPALAGAPPKERLTQYAGIADPARRSYAASVSALDAAVGQVLAALERRGTLERTLIVFLGDNGGGVPTRFSTADGEAQSSAADNGLWREGRGSLYEGGVRVPALAYWPGKIKPGTVVSDPLHVADLYPTLLVRAGAPLDQPKKPDGLDAWPALAEGKRSPHAEILIAVEDFRGAIRVGEWKLIVHAALPSRYELFDIANDPEEADNRAEVYPERVKDLLARLNAYAYDMAPSKQLEELLAGAGQTGGFWRHNPVKR
jgi:arylsulfatase A-like enzyme